MINWDYYWTRKQTFLHFMYDRIAAVYRRHIIKPHLEKYINRYFNKPSLMLHAGCGGGQVDTDLAKSHTIIGMDISKNALALYKTYHKNPDLVLGDITAIGIKPQMLDGIYNLGVMEHFNEHDINVILSEFNRVLKPEGTVILFIPPEYGSTVIFFKCVNFILNTIFRMNIEFQPQEPSRIKSREQVENILNKSGFVVEKIRFGIEDLYTNAVLVLKKASGMCPVCNSTHTSPLYDDTLGNDSPLFNYEFSPDHMRTHTIVKCRECSHAFSNIRADLWNKYQSVIDPDYMSHQQAHILTAQKVIEVLKKYIQHGKLLDVGCATGDFLSVAQEQYTVEGLEPSVWSSGIAKQRGFVVHTCTINELPADTKFDIITLWGVLEHFGSLTAEVKTMYRILNPDGYVCIWTGDSNSWLARLLGKNWWYIQGQHVQVFSRKSLDKLFTDNNFKVETVETYPFTTTLGSLSKSFYRYSWLRNIAKHILENRVVRDKVITLKLPGEMLVIYKKNEVT